MFKKRLWSCTQANIRIQTMLMNFEQEVIHPLKSGVYGFGSRFIIEQFIDETSICLDVFHHVLGLNREISYSCQSSICLGHESLSASRE